MLILVSKTTAKVAGKNIKSVYAKVLQGKLKSEKCTENVALPVTCFSTGVKLPRFLSNDDSGTIYRPICFPHLHDWPSSRSVRRSPGRPSISTMPLDVHTHYRATFGFVLRKFSEVGSACAAVFILILIFNLVLRMFLSLCHEVFM